MSYVVGLTGGIGCGKSTIADLFSELGVNIVDADLVARKVVEKGSPLLFQITQHFGNEILTEQGELNRSKLRQIIFHSPKEKLWLEQLLHPAIRLQMIQQLEEIIAPYVLWVVPLLIENNLTSYCDRILVIDVLPEIQLDRVVKRDKNSKHTVQNIIATQVDRRVRLSYADDIIENNLSITENLLNLKKQIAKLHQQYLLLAEAKK